MLEPFRIDNLGNIESTFQLVSSRKLIDSAQGNYFSGVYKSIPWGVLISGQGKEQQFIFHAPIFRSFLFQRIILIPYIKKKIVEKGGYSIIGSSFVYESTTYVLFGPPGSGKTRKLLDASTLGATTISDSELAFLNNGQVMGLFDDIELRLRTISRSIYWSRLRKFEKFFLILCEVLSTISFRSISFNLSVHKQRLIKDCIDENTPKHTVFISLDHDTRTEQISASSLIDKIQQYEMSYLRNYGSFLFSEKDLRKMQTNMLNQLSGVTIWSLDKSTTTKEIIALR